MKRSSGSLAVVRGDEDDPETPVVFKEVLIVDEDEETHSAMRLAFGGARVRVARTSEVALRFLDSWGADLIVVQLVGSGIDGFGFIHELRARGVRAPIVVAGNQASRQYVIDAMNAGANYYIERPMSSDNVGEAVNTIKRRMSASTEDAPKWRQLPPGGSDDPLLRKLPLSKREKEIALKVSEGLSNNEIAKALGIMAQTVRNHLSSIYRKLCVNSRSQLMRLILTLK